jgi:hypothetical protein
MNCRTCRLWSCQPAPPTVSPSLTDWLCCTCYWLCCICAEEAAVPMSSADAKSSGVCVSGSVHYELLAVSKDYLTALEDVVCSICQNLAWNPVTTPCQHVFCAN